MRVPRTLKILGLLLAGSLLGGSAFAASSVITSSDIKDETIQNRDIDKGVITMNRFAKSTQDKINKAAAPGAGGAAGAQGRRAGPAGATGAQGPAGPQGVQGPPGAAAAAEFGVATVFVHRLPNAEPTRFAVLSVPLGTPGGTTTSGQFRFSCAANQAPCKVSLGAAVISPSKPSGTLGFVARVTIHKEDGPNAAIHICEYADGPPGSVNRVPNLAAAETDMQTPRNLAIGGTLDCGSTQTRPASGVVKDIWVPAASNGTSTAFYDVWVTVGYGDGPAAGRRLR